MTNLHFCILLGLACFALADPIGDIKAGLLSSTFIRLYEKDGSYTDKFLKDAVNFVPKIKNGTNVILYIPGYVESVDSSIPLPHIINAFLQFTNDTFMAFDYRLIEYNLYPVGVDLAVDIGKALAEVIDKMVAAGIGIERWHVIGFSLGAQISGAIGGNMNNTLPKITGLDPAGPLFTSVQRHLMSSDANHVIVIHGDMGAYGTSLQLGHVDFYPNFGKKPQPGCLALDPPFLLGDICSHYKIPLMYPATIEHPELFIGRSCDSDIDFSSGSCNNNGTALMGYETPMNTTGKYYLTTNAQYPYGRGIDGASYP